MHRDSPARQGLRRATGERAHQRCPLGTIGAADRDGYPAGDAALADRVDREAAVAGLRIGTLATLSDVDTVADAIQVAKAIPGSRFAAELAGALTGHPIGAAG